MLSRLTLYLYVTFNPFSPVPSPFLKHVVQW